MFKLRYFVVALVIILVYLVIMVAFPFIYSGYFFKTMPPDKEGKLSILRDSRKTNKLKIAVIGDSTGAGQGTDSVKKSFSYQYTEKYLTQEYNSIEYTNFAISGALVEDVLKTQVEELSKNYLDFIFVSIGANNVAGLTKIEDFKNSINSLAEKLKLTRATIVWLSIPDFITSPVLLPPLKNYLSATAKSFNSETKNIVESKGFKYIDIYNGTRDEFAKNPDKYFSKDKYHPSESGYSLWAEVIKSGLS